jgi:hypothetical protein
MSSSKYSMKCGLAVIDKIFEDIDKANQNHSGTNQTTSTTTHTIETSQVYQKYDEKKGKYYSRPFFKRTTEQTDSSVDSKNCDSPYRYPYMFRSSAQIYMVFSDFPSLSWRSLKKCIQDSIGAKHAKSQSFIHGSLLQSENKKLEDSEMIEHGQIIICQRSPTQRALERLRPIEREEMDES